MSYSSQRTRTARLLVGALCTAWLLCSGPALADGSQPTYRVRSGDSLSTIAKRHATTVAALCRANGIHRNQVIRIGQVLVLPLSKSSSEDPPQSGSSPAARRAQKTSSAAPKTPSPQKSSSAAAKTATTSSQPDRKKSEPSWAAYSKPPRKRGYIEIESAVGRWSGQAVEGNWHVPEEARAGITRVLASRRTGQQERIHGRLIRLLTQVSNQFGGRKIRIVSGYREYSRHQHTKNSKHYLGRAVDFSIPGVPNEVVRDYLRHTFRDVGVGYYPNSTHVHLDIREKDAYWVDHSRPGQPPQYGSPARPPEKAAASSKPRPSDRNAKQRLSVSAEESASPSSSTSNSPSTSTSNDEEAAQLRQALAELEASLSILDDSSNEADAPEVTTKTHTEPPAP